MIIFFIFRTGPGFWPVDGQIAGGSRCGCFHQRCRRQVRLRFVFKIYFYKYFVAVVCVVTLQFEILCV